MIDSERGLFVRRLRELYHVERELESIQARLAEEAADEDLEAFYLSHGERTTDQIARLEDLFDAIEVDPDRRETDVLSALLADRDAVVDDLTDPTLADLVDAEVGRAIERVEITRLETLLDLADRLDLDPAATDLLATTKTEAESGLESLRERSTG